MPDCWWITNLNKFLDDGQFSDVSIHVQDRTFKCHRIVLASASEYFSSMFGGNFKEGHSESVTLFEINAVSFESILKCVYSASMPIIEESNVRDLLCTSVLLGVHPVAAHCVNFILRNITSINALEMFSLGRAINNEILIDHMGEHIVKYIVKLARNSMFLDMQYDDLKILLERYRSSNSRYQYENFLLDALIRWLHSGEEREKSFEKLIEFVDFDKISRDYLEFVLKEYNVECRISEDSCNGQMFRNGSTIPKTLIDALILRKKSMNCPDALPLPYKDPQWLNITSTLHVYCQEIDKWETEYNVFSLNKFKLDDDWFESCSFRKSCLSRYNGSVCCLATVDKLDYLYCLEYPKESRWLAFHAYSSIDLSTSPRVLAPLPFSAFAYHRPVLCGSKNSNIFLYESNLHHARFKCKTVELEEEELRRGVYSYNCEVDKWFPVPDMKRKLSHSLLIADDELVYLIGGIDSENINHDHYVQAYDYRLSQWLELPNTINPYPCRDTIFGPESSIGGCAALGKLYIANGNQMEVFEPTARRWESIRWIGDAENEQFRSLMMYFHDNSLWVFDRFYNTCSTYNFVSQEWRVSFESKHSYSNFSCYDILNVVTFKPLE